MKRILGLGLFVILSTVQQGYSIQCFNCTYTEDCKDEVFQDYSHSLVDCGSGSCIKTKFTATGKVSRYCSAAHLTSGCLVTEVDGAQLVSCACDFKNGCNGPVGDTNAQPGGLQCFDCYLAPECSDEAFESSEGPGHIRVNCGTGSCIKTKVKSTGQVHRHCSPVHLTSGCMDQTFDGVAAETCACDQDDCNTATVARVTVFSLGLAILVSLSAI